mgnify:CR=1 FL=1
MDREESEVWLIEAFQIIDQDCDGSDSTVGNANQDDFTNENYYQKFNVLVEDDELIFYKSLKTGRWWIEIPFLPDVNNKLKKHTLLPCMHADYLHAIDGEIPERWYKAYRKNSF